MAEAKEREEEKAVTPPPEEKLDPGKLFEQAITTIIDVQDVRPFEDIEAKFSPAEISDFVRNNINAEGILSDDDEQKLDIIIKSQLDAAFASEDPSRVPAVLATLGVASRNLEDTDNIDISKTFEELIEKNVPLENIGKFRGKVQHPVSIPELIDNLFGVDLQNLQRRNLGLDEINAIRADFQTDLDELEQNIIAESELVVQARRLARLAGDPEEELFIFGQNTFRKLQEYIDEHVENDQLRLLLLNDIQNRIAQDREKIGVRLGNAPRQITPISATEVKIISEPLSIGIANVLGENLDELTIRKALVDEADRFTKQQRLAKQDILSLARNFNIFIERNQIRDSQTGLLQVIPTEEKREGFRPAVPRDVDDILKDLNAAKDKFSRKEQVFQFVPTRIRDPGTGQTRERILSDLRDLQRMEKQKRITKRKPDKRLMGTISKRAKFKNAEILTGQRRRQLTTPPSESFGARMREIRIKREITLGELAKIANMIAMESGSLEDVQERPLLDVVKGVTTIPEIIAVIMSEQKAHSGNDFSLIFVPANVFGGMFLDGALDSIHKNRMLVGALGGNIFGSILKGIGSIATLPLQLVSGVLGGGLHRPADAPQHGGDLRDTFVMGEHQREPHVAPSHGDNQIFHIQPFPFGGKIDNTGFIDQSQMVHDQFGILPKTIWADMPLTHLTHFR